MENNRLYEYATMNVANRSSKRAANQSNIEWRNYNENLEYNETLGLARVKGTDVTFRAKIDERGRLIKYRGNILPDYRESDYTLDEFDDVELDKEFDEDIDSIKEIYKPIKGYDYEVSNTGQIRNVRTGRILKQRLNNRGYCQVCLCKDGVQKMFTVHRLVAKAFIPNPKNLPEVNHKDECKTNNRLDNLEWCTRKYNANYGTITERVAKALSRAVEQLDDNGNVIALFSSTMQIERVLGFFNGAISLACRKGLKRYGYYWRYKQ